MRGEKDLLQQILRVSRVAEHPARQAEQPPRMDPVQLLERPELAAPAAVDQRPLGVPGVRGRGVHRPASAL